jgi:3-keto-L-gulonate-6-phosphate decarboxylase
MAMKNVILKMKVDNAIQELMVKTGADNVIVDSATGKTLSTALAELAQDIDAAVAGGLKSTEVQGMIDTAISALINGAPETMDTLKELGEYADPPLSKSAVAHRMRRIEALAKE